MDCEGKRKEAVASKNPDEQRATLTKRALAITAGIERHKANLKQAHIDSEALAARTVAVEEGWDKLDEAYI